MNIIDWKKQFIKNVGTENVSVFIVTRKEKWIIIKPLLKTIPFNCQYFDPAKKETYPFINKMVMLNEKAYGKKMAAPLWTYANFGTIGAGINGGYLINNKPISKFNIVGDVVDSNISHEWTLLTDPDYQEKGIGKATLALAMQICSLKKYHTFISQTDNPANKVYLKNIYPLDVLSYGFTHTKTNSMFIKTKIPKNPFEVFTEIKKIKKLFPKNLNKITIEACNHQEFVKMNEKIQQGSNYFLIDWKKSFDEKIYLTFITNFNL